MQQMLISERKKPYIPPLLPSLQKTAADNSFLLLQDQIRLVIDLMAL